MLKVVDDEVSELKQWLGRRQGEAIAPGYRLNIGILNVSSASVQCTVSQLGIVQSKLFAHCVVQVLWTVTCGRKLHPQQQEFQVLPTTLETCAVGCAGCVRVCGQDNPVHVPGRHLLLPAGSAILSAVYHCPVQVLTKLLPESVTSIERGRYHRDRFHEIRQKSLMEAVFSIVQSLFILATVSSVKNGFESTDR